MAAEVRARVEVLGGRVAQRKVSQSASLSLPSATWVASASEISVVA